MAAVDDGCIERLSNAVEALLLCSDMNKGLESAFLSIIPLLESDFPTFEMAQQFRGILDKHTKHLERIEANLAEAPSSLDSHLRYSLMAGRTKHWFKRAIWTLFRDCVSHNLRNA